MTVLSSLHELPDIEAQSLEKGLFLKLILGNFRFRSPSNFQNQETPEIFSGLFRIYARLVVGDFKVHFLVNKTQAIEQLSKKV